MLTPCTNRPASKPPTPQRPGSRGVSKLSTPVAAKKAASYKTPPRVVASPRATSVGESLIPKHRHDPGGALTPYALTQLGASPAARRVLAYASPAHVTNVSNFVDNLTGAI